MLIYLLLEYPNEPIRSHLVLGWFIYLILYPLEMLMHKEPVVFLDLQVNTVYGEWWGLLTSFINYLIEISLEFLKTNKDLIQRIFGLILSLTLWFDLFVYFEHLGEALLFKKYGAYHNGQVIQNVQKLPCLLSLLLSKHILSYLF